MQKLFSDGILLACKNVLYYFSCPSRFPRSIIFSVGNCEAVILKQFDKFPMCITHTDLASVCCVELPTLMSHENGCHMNIFYNAVLSQKWTKMTNF